jgi:hypothetical protein
MKTTAICEDGNEGDYNKVIFFLSHTIEWEVEQNKPFKNKLLTFCMSYVKPHFPHAFFVFFNQVFAVLLAFFNDAEMKQEFKIT